MFVFETNCLKQSLARWLEKGNLSLLKSFKLKKDTILQLRWDWIDLNDWVKAWIGGLFRLSQL
jgi:hypothetical protein